MSLFSITSKARGWKAIFVAFNNAIEEASFTVNNDGVSFYCINSNRVYMILMELKKQNLDELTLDVEKTVWFRTDDINKIFKRLSADDTITISLTEKNKISIKAKGKNWNLSTIDNSIVPERKEPKIDSDVSFNTKTLELKNKLSDVGMFAESIHFIAKDGKVSLQTSQMEGDAVSEFDDDNAIIKNPGDTEYFKEYIEDVLAVISPLCENIKISFSNKKPILLQYEITGAGILRHILAPRVVQ